MKICPRCSYQNMDQDPVCRRCGFPLQAQPVFYQQPEGSSMNFQGQPQPEPRSVQDQPPQPQQVKNTEEKPQPSPEKAPEPLPKQKETNKSSASEKGPKTSFWQVLSGICLAGILLIMIWQNFGTGIMGFIEKSKNSLNTQREERSLSKEINDLANKENPIFDELGKMAEEYDDDSFSGLDIYTAVSKTSFESDISYALGSAEALLEYLDKRLGTDHMSEWEGTTSYQRHDRMQKLIGKYYRIEGKIKDVYPNGRVDIDSDGAGINVYGFPEEQMAEFSTNSKVDVIVYIIYAESIDGENERYYIASVYLQDTPADFEERTKTSEG